MATQRDWYKAAALALRDRIVHRWLIDGQAELRRGPQAGLLPQPRIPDRPAVHRRAEQYGAVAGVRDRARRSRRRAAGLAQMRAGCGARQWRPRAARGVLHGEHGDAGDPRHRLRHPLRFRPVPPDHRRRAGSRNIRTNGSASATPGNSSGRRWSITSISAAASSMSRTRAATARSGIRRKPCRRSPTTRRSSAGAASTSTRCGYGRRARPIRSISTSSTPATISAPVAEEARAESICKFLYPNDESPAGRELRLRQEYFFVSASLQDLVKRHLASDGQLRSLAHEGRGAAQRHPSEPRRRRADAHPGRPAQFPLGRGLEDHGRDAVLHQPHAAAGSAGDLAGRTVRAAVAAPSRDHLPHQRRASGAGRSALPRRHRFPRLGLADRREVRPPGADGTARVRRLAPHQRRLGDAFRPDEGDRVPRSQSSLSRPHHQQDQRHHLPPLADAGQSEADRRCCARPAARPCSTIPPCSSCSRPAPATPRSSSNSAPSSSTTRWRWRG